MVQFEVQKYFILICQVPRVDKKYFISVNSEPISVISYEMFTKHTHRVNYELPKRAHFEVQNCFCQE